MSNERSKEQIAYIKFIAIVLSFCVVAVIATIGIYERQRYLTEIEQLAQKHKKFAETYSLLYAEPLANGNAKGVHNYTVALIADPDVVSVSVTDINNKIVDEFSALAEDSTVYTRELAIHFAGEHDFRPVGKLRLQVGTHRIDAAFGARLSGMLVLFGVLVVAVFLSVAVAFRFSLKGAFQTLTYHANHDQLTDLINRRAFVEILANVLARRRDTDKYSMLLFIDLDDFKIINDSKGHLAGDGALKFIASIFLESVRRMDIVARMGGDEFCILLPDCGDERAERIAQDICDRISRQNFVWAGESFRMGASIGVVKVDDDARSVDDYIRLADEACYRAKQRGRNRVELVDARRGAKALLKSV